MKMDEIRTIARGLGVPPGKWTKVELVRAIQHAEGNLSCFATGARAHCEQLQCLWRPDCA